MKKLFMLYMILMAVFHAGIQALNPVQAPQISVPVLQDIPGISLPDDMSWGDVNEIFSQEISPLAAEMQQWLDEMESQFTDPAAYDEFLSQAVDTIESSIKEQLTNTLRQQGQQMYQQHKTEVMNELRVRVNAEINTMKQSVRSDFNHMIDESGLNLRGMNQFQAGELPSFGNFNMSSGISVTDGDLTVSAGAASEKSSRDNRYSQVRSTHQEVSMSIAHESGFKITVFKKEDGYFLRNILKAHTSIDANADLQANAVANVSGSKDFEIDSDAASSLLGTLMDVNLKGSAGLNGQARANLSGTGNLNAGIDTNAVVDLNVIQKEQGFLAAIPLYQGENGSKVIFETGVKQRTDFVVLSLVSANAVANYNYSGNANLGVEAEGELNTTVTGTAGGASLPSYSNAYPFNYNGNHSRSTSGSGSLSADLKQAVENEGIKTSYGSSSTYLVIPVGIGYYSENGSRIRFMVDLKPERMNQPLHFRAPQSEEDLNEFFLNAFGGAKLDMDGRFDFDSFTILAGLNASFKTFEVNLSDVTGNDTNVTAPGELHLRVYTGVETDRTSVLLIVEAEAKLLEAKGAAYLDIRHRMDNGWSFGVLTGYEKHVEFTGVPEMRYGGNIPGSTSMSTSGAGSQNGVDYDYNGQGTVNYNVNHNTVLNEGEKGYREYNQIPLTLMLAKADAGGSTIYGRGSAVFVDQNDGRFRVNQVGGGVGYISEESSSGKVKRWGVNADVYHDRGLIGEQDPSFGVGVGFQAWF
jgi:hypothetical protein